MSVPDTAEQGPRSRLLGFDWRGRYVQRIGGRDQDSGLCVWKGWDSGGRWTLVTMVGVGREEKTKGSEKDGKQYPFAGGRR